MQKPLPVRLAVSTTFTKSAMPYRLLYAVMVLPNSVPISKYGVFPTISAGWTISQEDFMKELYIHQLPEVSRQLWFNG